MRPFVEVSDLRIVVEHTPQAAPLVDGVSFSIGAGEVLALIGESGSGKTTTALALLGYARPGCAIAAGQVRVGDTDVLALHGTGLAAFRGTRVAYVAQSASASFNPSRTLMDQVTESVVLHGKLSRAAAQAQAVELFDALSLPDPQNIGKRYPHQVSGGQLQRAMAAMALLPDPELVIFDEPTTALDVTTQIEVLRAFKKVIRERRKTAVYVSHDLAVVAQMADDIVVLQRGVMRERGRTTQVLQAPADDYTRTLMAARQPAQFTGATTQQQPLLTIRGLTAGYGARGADGLPSKRVLHDIDLQLARGSSLGVIGESGSGKSTLARVIAGLLPAARGSIELDGSALPATLSERSREQFRRVQIVFQDADTSLNPAHTVEQILGRPLQFYHGLAGAAQQARVQELLALVQLQPQIAQRWPRELSGGQRQRINLARALAAQPDLILCDEVTSALDTVVAAAILELLADLRRRLGISLLFISHDIATVRAVCDDVLVMYAGRKVEAAGRDALMQAPHHPYTAELLGSIPEMRSGWLEQAGDDASARRRATADAVNAAASVASDSMHTPEAAQSELCAFLPRCALRIAGRCDRLPPPRVSIAGSGSEHGKEILCHLATTENRE